LPGRVDHVREEEILTRPEFAEVAAEFETTGYIALDTLHDATVRFVASAAGFDVVDTIGLGPAAVLAAVHASLPAEVRAAAAASAATAPTPV
jgi:hypothetical protein